MADLKLRIEDGLPLSPYDFGYAKLIWPDVVSMDNGTMRWNFLPEGINVLIPGTMAPDSGPQQTEARFGPELTKALEDLKRDNTSGFHWRALFEVLLFDDSSDIAARWNACAASKSILGWKEATADDVLQFYIMLVAGLQFPTGGKRGKFDKVPCGFRHAPDFAQYMPRHQFDLFCKVFAYSCAPSTEFTLDKKTWAMIDGMHSTMTARRLKQINTVSVILDEMMISNKPKHSATGLGEKAAPSFQFEPRKPHPFGLMQRAGCDNYSGVLVWVEQVRSAELAHDMEY
jgi:hypothetical protein